MPSAFSPCAETEAVAVTTLSGSTRVVMNNTQTGITQVARICNTGTEIAFVAFGNSLVVATTTESMPIMAGSVEVFGVGNATHIAAVTAANTTTLYVTLGDGI